MKGALRAIVAVSSASAFSVYTDIYAKPAYDVSIAHGYDRGSYLLPQEAESLMANDDSSTRYRPMKLFEDNYLCAIPVVNATVEEKDVLPAVDDGALDRATQLLSRLDKGCLYYIESYWTYAVCYGEDVKQFHDATQIRLEGRHTPKPEKGTPVYILGRFDSDTNTSIGHSESAHYVSQKLRHGSQCDLTKMDRTVEIQYVCSRKDDHEVIASVKEIRTCAYQVTIHSPHLCEDPVFMPSNEPEMNKIMCKRILSDEDAEKRAEQPALPHLSSTRSNLERLLQHTTLAHISHSTEPMVSITEGKVSNDVLDKLKSAIAMAVVDGTLILSDGRPAYAHESISDLVKFQAENGEDVIFYLELEDGDVVLYHLSDEEALNILSAENHDIGIVVVPNI